MHVVVPNPVGTPPLTVRTNSSISVAGWRSRAGRGRSRATRVRGGAWALLVVVPRVLRPAAPRPAPPIPLCQSQCHCRCPPPRPPPPTHTPSLLPYCPLPPLGPPGSLQIEWAAGRWLDDEFELPPSVGLVIGEQDSTVVSLQACRGRGWLCDFACGF